MHTRRGPDVLHNRGALGRSLGLRFSPGGGAWPSLPRTVCGECLAEHRLVSEGEEMKEPAFSF